MDRIETRWELPAGPALAPAELAGLDLPAVAGAVLAARGLTTRAQIERYLAPRLADLPDPQLLPDAAAAAARLADAVVRRERIVIYGDYDADGVTATVLLVELTAALGAPARWYIPDRQDEGYGLHAGALRQILDDGCDLLITVDCGTNSREEVALARARGVDVIVTDHHLPQGEPAPALALLNPQLPGHCFPGLRLAGVGVAFHLAALLRAELRRRGAWPAGAPDLRHSLDLVALGTVADVVPLQQENRVLVAAGLARLAARARPGLAALLRCARVARAVGAGDVSFRIAPRLNARGRLARADDAVELLLTADEARAQALALRLEQANTERQRVEAETLAACLSQLRAAPALLDAHSLVLHDPGWHPGVVGIVAGRLAERFARPAFVIGREGRGSGRSIPEVDLHACLAAAGHLLLRHGGHRAAAGLRVEPARVPAFRAAFDEAVVARHGAAPFARRVALDTEVELDALDERLWAFLAKLEPCGYGNPRPVFASRGVRVERGEVFGQGHLKLYLDHPRVREAVAFGQAERHAGPFEGRFDLAYQLDESDYRGQRALFLKLKDLRPAR